MNKSGRITVSRLVRDVLTDRPDEWKRVAGAVLELRIEPAQTRKPCRFQEYKRKKESEVFELRVYDRFRISSASTTPTTTIAAMTPAIAGRKYVSTMLGGAGSGSAGWAGAGSMAKEDTAREG